MVVRALTHAGFGPSPVPRAPAQDAPQTPADEGATQATPARPLGAAELRALHLDLLGRPPFEAEAERWRARARHELVDALLATRECWEFWLEEQLYYFLLIDNFRPQTERVAELPDKLASGALDVRTAIHRIALSPSFDARNPGADTFVTVVMEQLNGIEVQRNARELDIGKRIYDGEPGSFLGKPGKCQADLIEIAIADRSFAQTFLGREYRRLLRVEPDKAALAEWVRRLGRDARCYRELLREWLLSPTWEERVAHKVPAPNRLFVRALYVDLLGRLPDPDESRRLRTALDGLSDAGPLRSVFARLLIDSGEVQLPDKGAIADPTHWTAGLFRHFLGREARPEELSTFVGAFHDAACRPATIVYALVTDPEYQSY